MNKVTFTFIFCHPRCCDMSHWLSVLSLLLLLVFLFSCIFPCLILLDILYCTWISFPLLLLISPFLFPPPVFCISLRLDPVHFSDSGPARRASAQQGDQDYSFLRQRVRLSLRILETKSTCTQIYTHTVSHAWCIKHVVDLQSTDLLNHTVTVIGSFDSRGTNTHTHTQTYTQTKTEDEILNENSR